MAGQKDKSQADNMQKIDLTTLTLPQLAQLKQQLEQVWPKIHKPGKWQVILLDGFINMMNFLV